MTPSKHIEYMEWCLERAAAASGEEREALVQLAASFQRCAVQIERSMSLIAESRALLAEIDRLAPNHRGG
jgi:hypothetical protein